MFELLGISSQALFCQLLIGLINGSFYALLSLGLAVIFGMLNIINFTHGAQYMLGAFTAYFLLLYAGLGYWWAILVAPIVVGITGIIVERLFLQWLYKLDHLYGLLLTFGLALIFEGTFRNFFGSSGLPYSVPPTLQGGQNLGFMFLPNYRAWVVVFSLAVCLTTWFVIERTKLGSYLRAATENPTLVRAFGINVPRMITLTYGFGVALAALAGVMAAPIYNVSPQMGANLIIVVFAVVVIGGMGSIMGAIVTGFGLGVIEGLTKVFFPEASNTVIFIIMAIVLLIRPAGLFGRGACRAARRAERDPPLALAQRGDRIRRHGGCADHRADGRLSRVPDEGAVLRTVRLRLQSADRLCRVAVVRACPVLRLGELCLCAYGQGLGLSARARDRGRDRDRRRLRPHRRRARHPPAGHLFRDDHARLGADDVFLRHPGAVHPRRGRHSGGAARAPVRPRRPRRPDQHVRHRAGDLPRLLPPDLPHRQFAVRRGAQGDPGERGACDLARLQDRPLQARRLRAVGDLRRRGGRDQGAGVPARLADRRRMADVGRGDPDDAGRRARHPVRTGGGRVLHGDAGELPDQARPMGVRRAGRDLRRRRSAVPPRHHRRARPPSAHQALIWRRDAGRRAPKERSASANRFSISARRYRLRLAKTCPEERPHPGKRCASLAIMTVRPGPLLACPAGYRPRVAGHRPV